MKSVNINLLIEKKAFLRKHLNSTTETIRDALRKRFFLFEETFCKEKGISSFQDPTQPTKELVFVSGFVSFNKNGDLEEKIFLECPNKTSDGETVQLDLSLIDSYQFFPGQIIAVYGESVSESVFRVHSIYKRKESEKRRFFSSFQVSIFSFPKEKNVFAFLEKIFDFLTSKKPEVVILIGPFFSQIDNTVVDFKFNEFIDKINWFTTKEKKLQFILIPSLEDKNTSFVYPQPPFKEEEKNILFYPNPSVFKINDVVFGISNKEILETLLSKEFMKGKTEETKRRLFSYLLEQKCFYPLFPPSKDSVVDYSAIELFCWKEELDCLFINSNLNDFEEKIRNTLCLSSRNSEGVFLINVKPDDIFCEFISIKE